jgi:hypothetical protein
MWRTYRNNLPGPVGVGEASWQKAVGSWQNPAPHLYENPVGEKLMIDLENNVSGQAVIYNGQGNRVRQVTCDQGRIAINIGDLTGGMYFLVQEGHNSMLKFMVIH